LSNPNEERLKEIFAKVFLIDQNEVNDKLARRDLEEWDSMGHLMLISEIESAFNVFINDDDIVKIKTLRDIKKVLRKLGVAI
jgi:acyl carrier protein